MATYSTYIASASGSTQIGYILLPMEPDDALRYGIEQMSKAYSIHLVLVYGMDWNDDLTPWPAKAVFNREGDFGGHAETFLATLTDQLLPNVESTLQLTAPHRTLIGISLSGLFALWAMCRTTAFHSVASLSGSLWYDGFVEWLSKQTPSVNRVFLSLGDREKNTRNPRMAQVEKATVQVCDTLQSMFIPTIFTLFPGTHFSPLLPRLEMALQQLVEPLQEAK